MTGRHPDSHPPEAPTPARLHWRWVGASAVGEALGLVAANAINVLVAPSFGLPEGRERSFLSALMIVAGALEGACLGAAQWTVLRRWRPDVPATAWIAATSVGFAGGWLLGALSSYLEPAEPRLAIVLAFAALTGVFLGVAVGLAQAVVLWKHGVAVGRWLGLTVLAWGLALPVSYAGLSLLPASWNALALAIGLATGAAVGAVVGAVTGAGLRAPAG